MSLTSEDMKRETIKKKAYSLHGELEHQKNNRCAFFEHPRTTSFYYARDTSANIADEGDPYSPIVKLFLSGLHTADEIGSIYCNYAPTAADHGIVSLCSENLHIHAQRLDDLIQYVKERKNIREREFPEYDPARPKKDQQHRLWNQLQENPFEPFYEVDTSGLKDLLRRDFPLYDGQSPNVDITRENMSSGPGIHDGYHKVHRLYMAAAFRILRSKQVGDRQGVAALLVDRTGKIIAWGLKNPAHPALHGESSAIFAYGEQLPADVRIYTTLKPCKMCAGLITTLASHGHRVYHGQTDPTTLAQDTTLDENHNGRLLDGRHRVPGVRGIVPIYHNKRKSSRTLAEMLADEYLKNGGGSPIDFATSNDARRIFNRSNRWLEAKINQYENADKTNRNVWAVLSYLTGFLNHIGVPTDLLNAPPVPAEAEADEPPELETGKGKEKEEPGN